MLRKIAGVLDYLKGYVEGCECHWDVLQYHLPHEARRIYEQCPWRGRRAPSLSAGGLQEAASAFCETSSTDLLRELSADLDDAERGTITADYERARAFCVFVTALKTAHYSQPPWCTFAIGHRVHARAVGTSLTLMSEPVRESLTSRQHHRKTADVCGAGARLRRHVQPSDSSVW